MKRCCALQWACAGGKDGGPGQALPFFVPAKCCGVWQVRRPSLKLVTACSKDAGAHRLPAVGVFDEETGALITLENHFNFLSEAFGNHAFIQNERGIQIDPVTHRLDVRPGSRSIPRRGVSIGARLGAETSQPSRRGSR